MTNTKKIQYYLNSFDSSALKSLKRFINSPFFNKKDGMNILLQEFTKTNVVNNCEVNTQNIFKKLNPDEPFNERKIQRLLAYFLQIIEQFITHYDLQNDQFTHQQKLMEYCNDIAFYTQFKSILEKSEKNNLSKPVKQHLDYLKQYDLLVNKYHYLSINNSLNQNEDKIYDVINEACENLDKYYLINKLRFIAISLNQKTIIKKSKKTLLTDEILKALENNQILKQTPLINAYYNIIKLLIDQSNDEKFQDLQKLLETDTFKGLDFDEKLLYDFALNYCANKINAGHRQYYDRMFELHNQILKIDSFYIDGYLFNDTIKNIVTIALRLNKLDWVEKFLDDYKPKFRPEERDEIYNYNKAKLVVYQTY